MKPGVVLLFLILLGGVLLSGGFALNRCSTEAVQASEVRQQKRAQERAKEQALQEKEENRILGEAEMKQGEMLFDENQFRASYEKFQRAVDRGATGTEICNAKALATLLSRRDYRRTLELGSMLKQANSQRPLTLNFGNLFRGGGGWDSYYPVFEVLALRASGQGAKARSHADNEAKKFSTPKMWPAPLLMYFAGDFTYSEFQQMLNEDPGPAAETEALLAIDDYLQGNEGATSAQRVQRALNRMEHETSWAGAKLFVPMRDLLPNARSSPASTSGRVKSLPETSKKEPEEVPGKFLADAGKTERTARLLSLFMKSPVLIGKQLQGEDSFPFTLQIQLFNSSTGHFSGRIDYSSLGSIHAIEGELAEDTFSFRETAIIRKGRSILDSAHSCRLLPDGRILGKWTSTERMWASWRNGKKQEIGAGTTHSGTETIHIPAQF